MHCGGWPAVAPTAEYVESAPARAVRKRRIVSGEVFCNDNMLALDLAYAR